ncbi:8387_t:CDS:2 [Racocetra persica]|uniref:8387_t:CDS:1 n=1 Tax=Racocetra persica TaxID=160502 RepID=A0ACA9MZ21_9GLOM|nr:8387_t:CDS:2 [Racocetra persica]
MDDVEQKIHEWRKLMTFYNKIGKIYEKEELEILKAFKAADKLIPTLPRNLQKDPQAIYTSRLLDFSAQVTEMIYFQI